MSNKTSIATINACNRDQFVDLLGGIFEHSPWVADLAFADLPADSIDDLHQKMVTAVQNAPHHQRMALICSHPELAGKEASAGVLTKDSKKEQSSAGLDQCSPEELSQLTTLNQQYMRKFDFPFIIAVTGLNRSDIINALQVRLDNSIEAEFDTSIAEIGKIGKIRLHNLIAE